MTNATAPRPAALEYAQIHMASCRSRRQALALIAAVPVALVAAGSLPDHADAATEARRRVGAAGLAFAECWADAASRLTGAEYEREAMIGTIRIVKDLHARYGVEEAARILREVAALMAQWLGGDDVA